MEFYAHYISISGQLTHGPFDAHGEDMLITTEMVNIIERSKADFPAYIDLVSDSDNSNERTRLVFEWNNQEAEFDLQFVTPDGYFDTWSNKAVQGYSSKQFFIENENRGFWQVNIDYKGNRSEMPTFLKVSVYHDYGLPGQDLEINVYTLWENSEKVQLFKFQQF